MDRNSRSTKIQPLKDFFATEAASGFAVVAGAVFALLWANSPWSQSYADLWEFKLGVSAGSHELLMDLRHWVNDGLMTIFFLVVGLEIKRELVEGELREFRKAITPFAAALGGMIVPAVIFSVINAGLPESKAWGMPIATDIALAVGLLAIAGPRVPSGAKLFLLALAIVDDLGAIIVIAVNYAKKGERSYLLLAAAAIVATVVVRRLKVQSFVPYIALGIVLWFGLHEAGIHTTIAGVIMGLLAPTTPMVTEDLIDITERPELADLSRTEKAFTTVRQARESVSVIEWLVHRLHKTSSFFIVPVFAIANAGVEVSLGSFGDSIGTRLFWGVALGLLIGKPVGILLATFIAVKLKLGALPDETSWTWIGVIGMFGGVGFTVSLFVAELSLENPVLDTAKLGILVGSLLAGVFALIVAKQLIKASSK